MLMLCVLLRVSLSTGYAWTALPMHHAAVVPTLLAAVACNGDRPAREAVDKVLQVLENVAHPGAFILGQSSQETAGLTVGATMLSQAG